MAAAEPRCPYCHDRLGGASVLRCPACHAGYHADCARELGRCAVLGCRTVEWANPRRPRPRDLASVLLASVALLGALASPGAMKWRTAGVTNEVGPRCEGVVWFEPLCPVVPTTNGERYFVTNHASLIYFTQTTSFTLNAGDLPAEGRDGAS